MAVTDSISGAQKLKLSTRAGTLSARDERSAAHIEILDLGLALKLISAEWLALEQQLDHATVFQGVAWASAMHQWLLRGARHGRDLNHEVVIARNKEGVLTAVWPIQVERFCGCDFVVGLGEPFLQYSDILIAPDVERAAVIDAMFIALQSLDRFSGTLLRKVREDARCVSRLSEFGRVLNVAAAPAVALRDYTSFPDYLHTIKAKTRKNLRNARNRLERENAELTHHVHQDPEMVAEVAQRAFKLRTQRLSQEGHSSRAFLDEGFEAFISAVCESFGASEAAELVAFELRLDDALVSLQWGVVDRGRYYAFMAARNPDFDAHSPGRLHLQDVLSSCMDLQVEVVDFLAPGMEYEKTWATEMVVARDYGVPFTPAGRLVLFGLRGVPRRLLRRVFDRLPNPLRQALLRLAS